MGESRCVSFPTEVAPNFVLSIVKPSFLIEAAVFVEELILQRLILLKKTHLVPQHQA